MDIKGDKEMKTIEEVLNILVDLKHSINGDYDRGEDFELKLIEKAIKELKEINIDSFHICNNCSFDFATCKRKKSKS